jgi:hypothetical protein
MLHDTRAVRDSLSAQHAFQPCHIVGMTLSESGTGYDRPPSYRTINRIFHNGFGQYTVICLSQESGLRIGGVAAFPGGSMHTAS